MANSLGGGESGQSMAASNDVTNRANEARRKAASFSIEDLRIRLLDTSARNSLISFRHSERSRTHARVINTTPNAIYEALVDGRALRFRSLPSPDGEPQDERTDDFLAALEAARNSDEEYRTAMDALADDDAGSALAAKIDRKLRDKVRVELNLPPRKLPDPKSLGEYARELGIDPSYDLTGEGKQIDEPEDVLQTLSLPDPMERKLSKIRDSARTVVEETGVNPLHIAFGFLEWYESDVSDKPLFSPLLLLPVDMDRKLARSKYQYLVQSVGDDIEINLTLSERLHHDFSVRLPAFDEAGDPESYIAKVGEEICRDQKRWRVRRFVTIGHFSFARLAMYHDLDETRWAGAGGLVAHPVLADLLGGTKSDAPSFGEEHDVDAPEVAAKVPLLVKDADSSQHSAIYDVMLGKNLVIEGPPGTGKSQTITNIIASALASGLRVLFVAEKMAALHVVKSRLDETGLGDFCLELHSSKSRKKGVLEALQKRLSRPRVAAKEDVLAAKLRDLKQLRETLTNYVVAMNAPIGGFGATVHDVLWGDRRRRAHEEGEEARLLDGLNFDAAEEMSSSEIDLRRTALHQCEAAAAGIRERFGTVRNHPWHGVSGHELSPVDFDDVCRLAADFLGKLGAVRDFLANLDALGVRITGSLGTQWSTAAAIAAIREEPLALDGLFQATGRSEIRLAAADWISACVRYRELLAKLDDKGIQRPQATNIEFAEAILHRTAAFGKHGAFSGDVSGLAELAASLRGQATAIRGAAGLATEAASLLGVGQVGTTRHASAVIRALEIVTAAGETTLSFVTRELVDKENLETIERAAAECLRLREEATQFASEFSLGTTANAQEIRRHAAALRSAGLFSFMNSGVRAASRYFQEISKLPAIPRRDQMAQALVRLAEHLDRLAGLTTNSEYQACFGRRFQGVATNVERALEAARWAANVRAEFSGADQTALAIRQMLLAGDVDRLDILARLARDSRVARLKAILEGIPETAMSLEALADALDTHADAALGLKQEVERYGIQGWIAVSDLPEIARLIGAARDALDAASPSDELIAAANGELPPPDGDLSSVEATLSLARALDDLDVEPTLREALRDCSPSTLASEIRPAAKAVMATIDAVLAEWATLRAMARIDERAFFGGVFDAATLDSISDRIRRAAEGPDALSEWVSFSLTQQDALELGLGDVLNLWNRDALKTTLPDAFERVLYRSLARLAFARYPVLGKVTGLSQNAARERFKRIDRELMEIQTVRLAEKLSAIEPPAGVSWGRKKEYTQTALIRNEIAKKKKHIALRQLLDRAGTAILALKPCFMMSPLSLAQFLKPKGPKFDLLVVDEASQMRPEDAVGAIARCKQIVVVGDPKQLPPTSFFDRMDTDVSDDEDEDRVDAESILDLAMSVFRPARRLRWHYRSRHGSLIAFSNRHFYDDDLIVFPSPSDRGSSVGVTLHKVDGFYKNRGNVVEAIAVCRGAVNYMKRHPTRSIGIATMNQVQRDLISDEMDRICAQDPEAEAYRARWAETLEPLFIKNLENVQGDERDAIFISTVFGPPAPDKRTAQTFGPINGPGGWRRLNVLFTRAKYAVRLYTSMMPEDVATGPGSSRGAQALRAYLAYANTGQLDAGVTGERDPDSDFEVFVSKRLSDAGYQTTPQVGVAGYFIDLAVRDPDVPGTYLIGIECDGAAYHSSKSARDRDRLRQQVLEDLGWTIYRIWSTDWFRDPSGETKRLIEFIEGKRRSRPIPEPISEEQEPQAATASTDDFAVIRGVRESEVTADEEKNGGLTKEDAREQLIRLREERILPLINGADPEACILRPAMINAFLRFLPEDEEEFLTEIPLALREQTDRRQMRYLGEILDIIGRVSE